MIITEDIEEAVRLSAQGEEVCFAINEHNRSGIFTVCYYELKYRTRKEFRCIRYRKTKDLLYWWLKTVSLLSFGYLTLIYEGPVRT